MILTGLFLENIGMTLFAVSILSFIFLSVFARRKTWWVILGFLRVVGALFAEPVRYLNRIVQQYAQVGVDGLETVPGTQRGLLTTFLFYLQVALAVGAIGILALGTYGAWKAFMPPPGSVERLNEGLKEVEKSRHELEAVREKIKTIESSMSQKKTEAVNLFKGEHEKAIQDAATAMANAERDAKKTSGGADALGKIKTFLADKSAPSTTWEPKDPKEKVESYISYQVIADETAKEALHAYIQQWFLKMVTQVELATFDESQIVRRLEAERSDLADDAKGKEGELKSQASRLELLAEASSLRPGGAILLLGMTLGQFLGFIWISGLLLEFLELSLRLACNVQELRDRFKIASPAHTPTSEPAEQETMEA